ncbi:MAG: MarR family winged helix-turn-helix transcriptional regulator [Candidatus Omnitrophota bacterium]
MNKGGRFDFGGEMLKVMPRLLREFMRRQEGIFTKGNLAVPDIIVMDALLEKGACTMGFLARILNLTTSAATVIIDRMIDKGLVKRERSQEDRRVVNVALLRKGEDTIKHINKERRHMANTLFSVLNEKEKKEYLRLIGKVYNGLSRKK